MKMSKKASVKKKGKQLVEVKDNLKPEDEAVIVDKSGNVCIKVLAKPGAKLNKITDISKEGIGIQINAPPVDGEANKELIGYVSEVLGIKKQNITLQRGSKSKHKVLVLLSGILSVASVMDKFHCAKSEE